MGSFAFTAGGLATDKAVILGLSGLERESVDPDAEALVAEVRLNPRPGQSFVTTPEEADLWLSAETDAALSLQRPLAETRSRLLPRARRKTEAGVPSRLRDSLRPLY